MDFNKLKDMAKVATEKTVDGFNRANELRKKASQETKIALPGNGAFSATTSVRKTVSGNYYIGAYSENPELFEFVNFKFEGSVITEKTITTGNTKQKGRSGSVLGGAAIGSIIAPGVGTVVGGMAGASRKKKGTVNTVSTTKIEEKPGRATIQLRNLSDGTIKNIYTKLTQAEANNVDNFFRQ
ncbi:hypothetical protein Javan273_0048 [Streptococcus phage Javan273]|nr:hypothetical protein BKX95_00425 [Streptococcus iniae]QBX16790.1 hypothetical protein Javan273_0048 [Streptococcus phage Javan273]